MMRTVLVVGFLGFALSGCDPSNEVTYAPDPHEACKHLIDDKNITDASRKAYSACIKTPEALTPVPQMPSNNVSKRSNIDGEAWIRMGSAIGCQGRGGTFNHNTWHCTLPQQPRIGNVYDNSGRLIGTYVEN
jgi:hypothetical protein